MGERELLKEFGWLGRYRKKHKRPEDHFAGIYGRGAQVNLLLGKVKAFMESDGSTRLNGCIYGPPACGKTLILRSTANYVRGQGCKVVYLEGTSVTRAGLEEKLIESSPDFLMFEEIEKADPKVLAPLLGVLGPEGVLRKDNARRSLEIKLNTVCLATANDLAKFKKMLSGALESRFSSPIFCPRPDREVLTKILEREVLRSKGSLEWVQPTLDYCVDENPEKYGMDPRKIIDFCLSGRERILSGEHQKDLETVEGQATEAARKRH